MIQRIQSVYLFVAAALTFCLYALPFASVEMIRTPWPMKITACHLTTLPSILFPRTIMLPLSAVTICAIVLCVVAIFLYRNRTNQMKVVKLSIALQAIVLITMVAYYLYFIRFCVAGNPQIAIIFPIINIILLVLAYRGIKKDDDLVKSADRLR